LVLYATRHGQSHKIADRMAGILAGLGFEPEVRDAGGPDVDPAGYQAALLIASVHMYKHEKEMVAFARRTGADTDASRDYEYTDCRSLRRGLRAHRRWWCPMTSTPSFPVHYTVEKPAQFPRLPAARA
jgi:menaquinone-dependent protoporphyrinogen IX oxidase